MQFLRDNRRGISHPDLVDAIFERHVQPLVAHLWDGKPDGEGPRAFAGLHALLRATARSTLVKEAGSLREELVKQGKIATGDARGLAVVACDYGLRAGLDHVVVGMRSSEYVDSLRELLSGESSSSPPLA